MEGDFNFSNKWVFGHKSINCLYDLRYIPDDRYSQQESTAEDSKFDNRLTMDLSRQFCQPLVVILADADKCYDRINHIAMSLLLRAIVGDTGADDAMLTPVKTMKFYQRTGKGDSNTYMGGRPASDPLQGLCHGNKLAPACWLMKIFTIKACYKKAGCKSLVVAPISGEVNSNLLVFLAGVLDCKQLMNIAQASLGAWENF
jgi:hypothetical protein